MNNYSYTELQTMQRRAMERVRQLQKSSDDALQLARNQLEQGAGEQSRSTPPQSVASRGEVRTKHTNMPPNFPQAKQNAEPQESSAREESAQRKPPETVGNRQKQQNGLLPALLSEPDRALLTVLLLLLKSEGADEGLMMALAYIMT